MYKCTRGLKDSVVYHNTNSPGALNVEAGVKTREHDSRREHSMSREPPGYYFGKRVLLPDCSCRWPSLKRRVVHFDFSHGAASSGMLEFLFLRTRLYTARSYYWSEQDVTEKSSDEPPTDFRGLELELTKRTDREEHHLLRLPFVGEISFRFCLLFLRKTPF